MKALMLVLPYPVIDPVLIEVGPFAIRWYALAYMFGIILGWQYANRLAAHSPHLVKPADIDDFVMWATLGVVLGGRLGYVLFYKPEYYMEHPLAALAIWHGGMSFHGGLLGVMVAGVTYCRNRGFSVAAFADLIFCSAPIGLFLGRIANFINGELAGRPTTDVPWAMVFPTYGPPARHPSQLYEAGLEGIALFVILYVLWRQPAVRNRPGILSGCFLIGYGVFRAFVETFREPDSYLGFLAGGLTMGQILSIPMILLGGLIIAWACRRPAIGVT
jgi:phosphatidylglycerol:prolipoprotein diacylglycerol transferase